MQPDLPSTSNETPRRGKSCCLSLSKKVNEGYDNVLFLIQGNVFSSLFQMNHLLAVKIYLMHQYHLRQMKELHVVSHVVGAYLKKLMKATMLIQGNVLYNNYSETRNLIGQ